MGKLLQFKVESHICGEGVGQTEIICGWETHRPKADKETWKLSQIYCLKPKVCWYGSDDCSWECWEAIEKKG